MEESAHGTPAPYGQACTNCSRAKCRCTFRGGGLSCERCHRLSKDCQPAVPARKRGVKRRARTAQLEEKLEDLVSLLRSQSQGEIDGAVGPLPKPAPPEASHEIPCQGFVARGWKDADRLATRDASAGQSPDTPSSGSTMAAMAVEELTPYESEACLETFRSIHLSLFPFISIPASTSWSQLKADRSVLWLCIAAVTTKGTVQQHMLGDRAKEIVAKSLMVNHERDLDTLLGLLVLLSWSVYQVRGKPFLWLFVHLAMSLAGDLGLDRAGPFEKPETRITFTAQSGFKIPLPPKIKTLEECRAALTCFFTCSFISTFFQRPNPMRWTVSHQRCIDQLREAGEPPGDRIFVMQVLVQKLLDEVAQTPWTSAEAAQEADPDMLPHFHIKMFLEKLKYLKDSISADTELSQHHAIRLSFCGAELAIRELILLSNPTPRPFTNNTDLKRLEYLHACLHTVKHWLDEFFDVPPEMYVGVHFRVFADVPLCFQTLFRLTVLDIPGWDRSMVRDTADILASLDMLLDRMVQAPSLAGLQGGELEDVFTRTARMVRNQRAVVVAALEQAGLLTPAGPELDNTAAANVNVNVGPEFQGMMEPMDESWLAEIFGTWDRQQ